MDEHLQEVKKAYDQTVKNHNKGIENESLLPKKFRDSLRYQSLKSFLETNPSGLEVSTFQK